MELQTTDYVTGMNNTRITGDFSNYLVDLLRYRTPGQDETLG
jgi:hypothetical protein